MAMSSFLCKQFSRRYRCHSYAYVITVKVLVHVYRLLRIVESRNLSRGIFALETEAWIERDAASSSTSLVYEFFFSRKQNSELYNADTRARIRFKNADPIATRNEEDPVPRFEFAA